MRLMTMGSLTIAFTFLALGQSAEAQRGRGGYGGGMSRGGYSGESHSSGAMGPYGGSGSHTESSRTTTSSSGGQYKSGSGSGTYDTQRGGTVNYGAAGEKGTGAGGSSAGKGVYGVSGTTAGGKSYSDYGKVGGVSGAGGNSATSHSNVYGASGANGAVAGGSRSTSAYGQQGAATSSSRYGAAYGQQGAAAGGSRYGAAYGQEGAAAGGSRYGAAYGQSGYAAGGQSYGAVHAYGTSYAPTSVVAAQGASVRGVYAGSNYGSPAFYGSQQGAWAAPAGAMAASSAPAGWGAVASAAGYPAQPVYNDYGGNVVSQPNAMYVNGDPVGTPQQYAQQAGQIAASGAAQPDPNSAWQHLGVYALAQQDPNAPPADLFQLAINKQGVIRGNYHNTQTNKTEPVSGSVDPKSLRAAWSVGQQKAPIYEAGIANLTNDQTTMMIHDASGRSTQATLVKLQPDDGAAGNGQPAQR